MLVLRSGVGLERRRSQTFDVAGLFVVFAVCDSETSQTEQHRYDSRYSVIVALFFTAHPWVGTGASFPGPVVRRSRRALGLAVTTQVSR